MFSICSPIGCGSFDVHIHDIHIENGDDSIVMKPGWPTPAQLPPDGCTRDVLVERVVIYRGMGAPSVLNGAKYRHCICMAYLTGRSARSGANIGGMGSGCVDNVTFRDILLDHPSLAGVQIKTENGKDNREPAAMGPPHLASNHSIERILI